MKKILSVLLILLLTSAFAESPAATPIPTPEISEVFSTEHGA